MHDDRLAAQPKSEVLPMIQTAAQKYASMHAHGKQSDLV